MKFQNAVIFFNENKPNVRALAQEACTFLQDRGLPARAITALDGLDASADLLICMGGDGTMLRCARAAAPLNMAVFGVNCGTLGFLAACEISDFKERLEQLLRDECAANERFMLRAQIIPQDGKTREYLAFNDCVLRAAHPRAFTVNAVFNGKKLPPYFGDGVIISTPTGSTAYSLAAGGPIVEPGVDVLLITPICPHTLHQRPLILPAGGELELVPAFKNKEDGAVLSVDGQINLTLPPGARVKLTRSPLKAKLLCTEERDFFSILNRKLNWGAR